MKKKSLRLFVIGMGLAALLLAGCSEVVPTAPVADAPVEDQATNPVWD